jgi:hypothetical protein
MKMFKLLLNRAACVAALAGLLLVVGLVSDAYAQIDVGKTYQGWSEVLSEIVKGVVGVLAAFGVYAVHKYTGIKVQKDHREALQTAITNAAGLALNKLGNVIPPGTTITTGNSALDGLAQYVLDYAPDAVRYFGLTENLKAIEEKIIAKIPQVANTTVAAIPAAVTP